MTPLDEETDRLTAAIGEFAALLRTQSAPEAAIELREARLEWAKQGADWLLRITDANGQTPLLRASRARRIEAAERLPDLYAAIETQRAELHASVKRALAIVEALNARIRAV